MLKLFKYIAILEGLSLLALFFFAMPMRRFFQNDAYIRPIGMAHGILFIAYILLAIIVKYKQNWSFKIFSIVCLASFVPFGTFYIENKYFKNA